MSVTTVEGIGSTTKGLHPVQEKIANGHGSQCGFCTPGIVDVYSPAEQTYSDRRRGDTDIIRLTPKCWMELMSMCDKHALCSLKAHSMAICVDVLVTDRFLKRIRCGP